MEGWLISFLSLVFSACPPLSLYDIPKFAHFYQRAHRCQKIQGLLIIVQDQGKTRAQNFATLCRYKVRRVFFIKYRVYEPAFSWCIPNFFFSERVKSHFSKEVQVQYICVQVNDSQDLRSILKMLTHIQQQEVYINNYKISLPHPSARLFSCCIKAEKEKRKKYLKQNPTCVESDGLLMTNLF